MKLPYKENSLVPRRKLTNYLLSETHPVGNSKSKFFRKLGFDKTNIEKLIQVLLQIADGDVKDKKELTYGVNYVIDWKHSHPVWKNGKNNNCLVYRERRK